ncbi:protein F37C4.5 [Ditylenchus destructor]|uniref:Protein F37C4.5 n=1 Tax=Ditylenchus destructor TaxID=166010 RepID=A0AAD4NJE1_9BILA|nr:protein F37C4.5 [Ditylenchus destructor]
MNTDSTNSQALLQRFEARNLPIKTVTVFTDRAEVKRTLKVTLQEGLNNVAIDNVASTIENDSIRVDGHGNATIHEVQFKTEQVTQPEVDSPQVKELLKELEELKSKCAQIEDLKEIYKKRLESLDNVINNLGKTVLAGEKNIESTKFDETTENSFDKIYEFHEKRSVNLHSKMRSLEKELNDQNEKVKSVEQKISNLRDHDSYKRLISIMLETNVKDSVVELEITYQVYQSYWRPSYDVRVQTVGDTPQLKLVYLGNVSQMSGEDWSDVDLLLSTGSPRLGGKLPELRTLRAQFPQPKNQEVVQYAHRMVSCAPTQRANKSLMMNEMMLVAETEVNKSTLASTFAIPLKKTIPSDNSEHKVTIAVLEFVPVLHFDCVPSKNTNVFMTATVINASTYPLLPGMASVYVDNSFSSKVGLPAVAAGEKFDCSLGVDTCVKVQYKPAHKYQQQTGMLSKSAVSIHEQKISVKNTKSEPVLLTVHEHIPKSTDEKIKVKINSPEIKNLIPNNGQEKSGSAILNDSNNLEWTVLVGSKEEKELCVKWATEYPTTETVEYKED